MESTAGEDDPHRPQRHTGAELLTPEEISAHIDAVSAEE
jgi:hypothetical protein